MSTKKANKTGGAETLLVELLTEELPPKALQRLARRFCDTLVGDLRQDDLLEENSQARTFATPRRLAVSISNVLTKAPDKSVELSGPSVKVGLDSTGKPTPALIGFAKKNGVTVDELVQVDTPKGKVFACRKVASGTHLETNLDVKVEEALKRLPVAKKMMRWGAGEAEFVRPVHGLVMLHGSRVVAGEVLGVKSSNSTLGHRFLSGGAILLKHADDYERVLCDKGKVIADFAKRRTEIARQLEQGAGDAQLVVNDALLDEIAALVEIPAVYSGEFDAGFLAVPEECLILSMQQHQKYVPLRDRATGKLLSRFLFVSNIETGQPREIVHGNERVLRARLADAKFFYDQDRKARLATRVPRLAHVVYHSKLGSQLQRVERIHLLAGKIAREIGAEPVLAERAAWLSKADLLTEMVGEFPELQGVMGSYYALQDGEPREVADAIAGHYRPRFAGDILPDSAVACTVALADKLGSLVGLFGIGDAPTGEKDPFGLRRAALGLIRILVEKNLSLHLGTAVSNAFDVMQELKVKRVDKDVVEFIYERFAGYLKDLGFSTLQVESVLIKQPDYLNLVPQQLEAVKAFQSLPEAESLAAANKRVANILKQARNKGESINDVDPGKLQESAERNLFDALKATSERAQSLYRQGDFTGYLKSFSVLKSPVDAFFDSVMVMAEDPALRQNRLALLAELREQMNRVADISKLAV
jgi:glycyl-tRNA synthetase beta chain